MALDVIKNIQTEVEELKKELEEAKKASAEVKEIEAKLADIERKGVPSDDVVTGDTLKKAEQKAVELKLKSILTERPVDSFEEFKEVAGIIEKAIKPSDITAWVDEKFSNEIIDLMELELKVEKLFGSVTVPDGVESFSIPQKTGRTQAYLIQPAQDAIESVITAGKVTFSPVKLKTLVTLADETKNEAVVGSILQIVKEDIAYSLAKGSETAIVNGDVSGALNANPAATDVTKAFDGLRKYGDVNKVDNGGGVFDLVKFRQARAAMGVYGVDPTELVLLVNPRVFYQLLNVPELQTIDKIGNEAVLKKGTVGMIDGIQVVLTEVIPNNLDANGAVDIITPGTATAAVLVNTKAFRTAKRNAVEAERDRNITSDLEILVGRRYLDFKKIVVDNNPVVAIVNIGG